jgi:hypothetical protein
MNVKNRKFIIKIGLVCLLLFIYLRYHKNLCYKEDEHKLRFSKDNKTVLYNLHEIEKYPMIFIGGYARSGTTLMRAILDVHPSVTCGNISSIFYPLNKSHTNFEFSQGPETKILPQSRLKLSLYFK